MQVEAGRDERLLPHDVTDGPQQVALAVSNPRYLHRPVQREIHAVHRPGVAEPPYEFVSKRRVRALLDEAMRGCARHERRSPFDIIPADLVPEAAVGDFVAASYVEVFVGGPQRRKRVRLVTDATDGNSHLSVPFPGRDHCPRTYSGAATGAISSVAPSASA